MGQPDQVNAGVALSTLLRQWWQSEEQPRKQGWIVARLQQRGIDLTQATLSRYLDPAKPQIARQDVVRALHEIFGRSEEELSEALELWWRATRERDRERAAQQQQRERAASAPAPVPAPLPEPEPAPVPVPAQATEPVSEPAFRWPRRLPYGVAAAAVALVTAGGTLWLTPPWGREPVAGAAGAPLASCEGRTCYALEPNHTVCKNDAVTARIDTEPVIEVELRYSAVCKAAWAKMTNTTRSDVARIENRSGLHAEYTQTTGRDAHTTMVPAERPEDATACAVTAVRTVCATAPAPAASKG